MNLECRNEYIRILQTIEDLIKRSEKFNEQTAKLKELYNKAPDNKALLELIKIQEENYKKLIKQLKETKERALKLKDSTKNG